MEEAYAKALLHSIEKGVDHATAVRRMHEHLAAVRKQSLWPKIAHAFARHSARAHASVSKRLIVARETDVVQAKKELKATLGGEYVDVTPVVDPTIIGGWRYESGDMLIDASDKQQLMDIYQNIAVRL